MQIDCYGFEISMGSDHCRKLLITTYFRGLDGDSLLAVDCVRRMLRSRSGQSDRLEDDDAGAGDPLPLSRGEAAPHHGQTVKSRQAADFSRAREFLEQKLDV